MGHEQKSAKTFDSYLGFSRNWPKIVQMGSSPPKFIIKVGMAATFCE